MVFSLKFLHCYVLHCYVRFDIFISLIQSIVNLWFNFAGLPVYEAFGCLDERLGAADGSAGEVGHHCPPAPHILDVRFHVPHWLPHRYITGTCR